MTPTPWTAQCEMAYRWRRWPRAGWRHPGKPWGWRRPRCRAWSRCHGVVRGRAARAVLLPRRFWHIWRVVWRSGSVFLRARDLAWNLARRSWRACLWSRMRTCCWHSCNHLGSIQNGIKMGSKSSKSPTTAIQIFIWIVYFSANTSSTMCKVPPISRTYMNRGGVA